MKNLWIIVLIVLVLVAGYLGRHQIKTMFMGSATPAPVATTTASPEASSSPSSASASAIMTTQNNTAKGIYMADSKGMTLYIFDKDSAGVSNCNGSCATVWPPYMAGNTLSLPANFTVIKRTDGSMQYAFKGMPLYYYAKDTKVGDVSGDGVNGVWHLVKP